MSKTYGEIIHAKSLVQAVDGRTPQSMLVQTGDRFFKSNIRFSLLDRLRSTYVLDEMLLTMFNIAFRPIRSIC